jgi:RNA polymerase sigma factor (sigma-70 family)
VTVEREATNGESDEVLMERFRQGDAAAFDALFERYARPLHAYLWRLVGHRASVEDLVQTTFLSLVRARNRYRKGARFRPWLYAIATNAARDYHRRSHHDPLAEGAELPQALTTAEAPPEDTGVQAAVRRALAQLPESQRIAVVLLRFEDMSLAEIAEMLETSEGAVKLRAHRGYERLRELLRGLWEEMA